MKTINELKTKTAKGLHGKSVNKIVDIYSTLESVSEFVNSQVDIVESIRTAVIVNAVYDSVSEYELPEDAKLNGIISISPQAIDVENTENSMTTVSQFNSRVGQDEFAVETRDGKSFLRLRESNTPPVIITKCEDKDEFSAVTNVSAVSDESFEYIAGTQSVKASLVTTNSALASVSLSIGDNSLQYRTMTVSEGHFEPFKQGWNLLRFDLKNSIATGAPTMQAVQYMKISLNTGIVSEIEVDTLPQINLSGYISRGAIFLYLYVDSDSVVNYFLIDSVTAHLGTVYKLKYYSDRLFLSADKKMWLKKPETDGDFLVITTSEGSQMFENELKRHAAAETLNGKEDYLVLTAILDGTRDKEGLYERYEIAYPSQAKTMQADYYQFEQNHGY